MIKFVRIFAVVASIIVLLSACVVSTEEPVYIEKFGLEDVQLPGVWVLAASDLNSPILNEGMIITDIGDGLYWITNIDPGEPAGKLRLMKFGGYIVFTFEPFEKVKNIYSMNLVGLYFNNGNSLKVSFLSSKWFKQASSGLKYEELEDEFLYDVVLEDTDVNIINFLINSAAVVDADAFITTEYVRVR